MYNVSLVIRNYLPPPIHVQVIQFWFLNKVGSGMLQLMFVQVNIICSLNPAHLPAHKLLRKLFACLFVCLRAHIHSRLTRSVYLTYRIETVNKFRYQQLVCFSLSPPSTPPPPQGYLWKYVLWRSDVVLEKSCSGRWCKLYTSCHFVKPQEYRKYICDTAHPLTLQKRFIGN